MKIKITLEIDNDKIHEIANVFKKSEMNAADKTLGMIGRDYSLIYTITKAISDAEQKI